MEMENDVEKKHDSAIGNFSMMMMTTALMVKEAISSESEILRGAISIELETPHEHA